MLTRLSQFANTIRAAFGLILLIIGCIVIVKLIKYFENLYEHKPIVTEHIYKPVTRPEPDTIIKWLERIKEVKVEPEIVYDTVYYEVSRNHLIKTVDANGNKILVQTQYCGEKRGKEFIYPYTERFQLVAGENQPHFTEHKDYLDWDKLYTGYSSDCGPEVETRILFKPLRLEGSLKASFKEIEGKILLKLF